MFNLFGPIQTAKYDVVVEGRSLNASLFSLVEYYLVAALAIIGAFIVRHRRDVLYVVLLWPALVAMVAVLGFGNNRYRATCEPALLWLAGVAIYAFFGWIREAKRSRVSATTQKMATNVSS
jgi:ABC-type Fe3+-siderophore transport system permease subunit